MRERHNRLDKWVLRSAGSAAAVVFCLAGTAVGLAQTPTTPAPGIRNPMTPPSGGVQAGLEKVKVDEHMIVDLHVNDEDLGSILQMLSLQSQRSIVASRNVSAMVTANLYGVTFYEALDAILHVNGYGYIERGNFIYVYTLDELSKIEQAQRLRVWRVVKLDYLNAIDAAEFIKPLLSEQGQIKTNGRPVAFSETGVLTAEDFANESTMLIYDFEENLEEMERVLKELDTRPAQVLIEATILQTALTEANAFGIDFSIIGDMDFLDFVGGPLRAVDALIGGEAPPGRRGQAGVSTVGNTGGPSTLKVGIVHNDISAFLRVLDEVSDTTILSRPNLLILNRSVGRVLVGRKVGYLSTTSTDTATTQSVEFLDTGTQLIVRPFISQDGMIRMELKPKVSEAVIRNATTAGGQAVTIPDEISNELTTSVLVRDGQTIVLGGLFRESTQATRRQIPFAGDLPLIGAAFRGREDDVDRNEVIFMITPTIMADTMLLDQGRRAQAAVEQVRTGSRQGLLFFSREKRTQQMLVQARELAQRGEREQAIYKVNRALRLNPHQQDALAMRERLMQERTIWPTRSMQHEIITGEIDRLGPGESVKAPQGPGVPKPTVEVDAGDGVAWFDDDGDQGDFNNEGAPGPFETPSPSTEQATVNEDQVSSAAPTREPQVKQPKVDSSAVTVSASTPAAAVEKAVQPGSPASTMQAQSSGTSTAKPMRTSTAAATPTFESTAAYVAETSTTATRKAGTDTSSRNEGAGTQVPSSASAGASAVLAEVKSAGGEPDQSPQSAAKSAPTTLAANVPAEAKPAGTAGAAASMQKPVAPVQQSSMQSDKVEASASSGLRANVAAGESKGTGASQGFMWSSALAAALEESGGLPVAAEKQDKSTEPEWIVAEGADPSDWTLNAASDRGPTNGAFAVLGGFKTVWDLFSEYASRPLGPDSTVTTVPTGRD